MAYRNHVNHRHRRFLHFYSGLLKWGRKTPRRTKIILLFLAIFVIYRCTRTHPCKIPANATKLIYPSVQEDVIEYAQAFGREKGLPVYIFYPGNSGQLNNQLISLVNALCIAKLANATLVTPFAYYGAESLHDFASGRSIFFHIREVYVFLVRYSLLRKYLPGVNDDSLVGDYLDVALINQAQPVMDVSKFLHTRGARVLQNFRHVLVRKGEADSYYDMLQGRSMWRSDVKVTGFYDREEKPEERDRRPIASRRELDCNFNLADFFRGLTYRSGVNGNYLFMPKLYRTHALNCSRDTPYWLHVRRYIQPRAEFRQLVATTTANWGRFLSIHLRLFPRDAGKFTPKTFVDMLFKKFGDIVDKCNFVYIAYSVTSEDSVAIVKLLRDTLGAEKVLTARKYGDIHSRGPQFDKVYAVPLIDMWTCVTSSFFIGRSASSLSVNVRHWRDALAYDAAHGNTKENYSYGLRDFSPHGYFNPADDAKE